MAKRQNGKGTLRKRSDGRWEGRFNIGVNDNGKPKVKYILAKTQSECAHKLKAAIEEYEHDNEIAERCTILTNPNPTLSEMSEIAQRIESKTARRNKADVPVPRNGNLL
nr:hypothetical protein [uncultured Ruminococcus sp.]